METERNLNEWLCIVRLHTLLPPVQVLITFRLLQIVEEDHILGTADGDVTSVRQNQLKMFSSYHVYKIVPSICVNKMNTHLPNSSLDTENVTNTVSRALDVYSLFQTVWQFT